MTTTSGGQPARTERGRPRVTACDGVCITCSSRGSRLGEGPCDGAAACTVTFLFTDLEGSMRRWEAHPAEMRDALARHDAIVRGATAALGDFLLGPANVPVVGDT